MGDRLGQYEIRGRLGQGAMAVVWRAWDTQLEREVAIKEPVRTPNMTEAMAAEVAERFVREGKTAARLSHPGVVTIYAADVFDGRSAIVMELLRGHTLAGLIDTRALPMPAVYSILDQLLAALEYAHSMGVIHRDIKPDNIFVTDDGRVKLTDFGVAHVNIIGGTGDAVIAGSPGYMSPEQIRAEPVDARSDLFAVGAIAYEMLTGHNPFGATDGLETTTIMYRTLNAGEVTFPFAAETPASMKNLIMRALAVQPEARYQNASVMRCDLNAAASGAPVVGMASLQEVVEEAGPVGFTGVSFTSTTKGEAASRPAQTSGSAGRVVMVSLALVGSVLAAGALFSQPGSEGLALLFAAIGGIGGFVWVITRGRDQRTEEQSLGSSPSVGGLSDSIELALEGPSENRVIRVAMPATIGRSAESAVIVADETASRAHALLERRDGQLVVSDLDSNNGTYVNGAQIHEPTVVDVDSVIRVGSTCIQVVRDSHLMEGAGGAFS